MGGQLDVAAGGWSNHEANLCTDGVATGHHKADGATDYPTC